MEPASNDEARPVEGMISSEKASVPKDRLQELLDGLRGLKIENLELRKLLPSDFPEKRLTPFPEFPIQNEFNDIFKSKLKEYTFKEKVFTERVPYAGPLIPPTPYEFFANSWKPTPEELAQQAKERLFEWARRSMKIPDPPPWDVVNLQESQVGPVYPGGCDGRTDTGDNHGTTTN